MSSRWSTKQLALSLRELPHRMLPPRLMAVGRRAKGLAEAIIIAWRTPDLFDAARAKPTWQSSYDPADGTPAIAADGSYPNERFHMTLPEARPWWIVDLREDLSIHAIRIENRAGRRGRQAAPLTITISSDREHWQIVHSGLHHFGDSAAPEPLEIRLLGKLGRYVRLELPSDGVLCPLRVKVLVERHYARRSRRWRRRLMFALATPARGWRYDKHARQLRLESARHTPKSVDVALRAVVRQSSTVERDDAHDAAVVTAGNTVARGFVATRHEQNPWWMADLGASYPIYLIRIHNRPGPEAKLAACLVVSISDDQRDWERIHAGVHFFGDLGAPGPLDIRLLSSRNARFVRLELLDHGKLAVQRIEILVECGLIALRATCQRYDFLLEDMLPTSTGEPRYTVDGSPDGFDGTLKAFHVTRVLGRFGNQLKMIAHAVCLARRIGVGRVYLSPLGQFPIAGPIEADGVTLLPETQLAQDRPGAVLSGSFYYWKDFDRGRGQPALADFEWAMRHFVRPLFQRAAQRPAITLTESDLAIHIRSGDIFATQYPNSKYVQPPLSYYQLVLRHAQDTLGVQRVILVYEDDVNPCVGALKGWLRDINVPFIAQSASLTDDLALLMQARVCVFGHGTFGPAIMNLSDRMRIAFIPWTMIRSAESGQVIGIRTRVVRDAAGKYIQTGTWRNSPEQRQVMLDYPIENLALDES